jgi:hypothetical protein
LATLIKLLETVSKGLSHVLGLPPYGGNPAVPRSLPKEALADSFQKFYERYQPCVVKDDDYFEGQ